MTSAPLLGLVAANDDEATLPSFGTPHYLAEKRGLFLRKRTIFGNVTVPLKGNRWPEGLIERKDIDVKGSYDIADGAKPPMALVYVAHRFFRDVWNQKHTEAELFLLYGRKQDPQWELWCPPQNVTGASVHSHYDPDDLPKGYAAVGTLHSHCNFSAFHSGTDSGDASDFDGLHFTIGHVDRPDPEVVAMLSTNGVEFHFKPSEVTTPLQASDKKTYRVDPGWISFIDTKPAPVTKTYGPMSGGMWDWENGGWNGGWSHPNNRSSIHSVKFPQTRYPAIGHRVSQPPVLDWQFNDPADPWAPDYESLMWFSESIQTIVNALHPLGYDLSVNIRRNTYRTGEQRTLELTEVSGTGEGPWPKPTPSEMFLNLDNTRGQCIVCSEQLVRATLDEHLVCYDAFMDEMDPTPPPKPKPTLKNRTPRRKADRWQR